jgi:hypothetical protein
MAARNLKLEQWIEFTEDYIPLQGCRLICQRQDDTLPLARHFMKKRALPDR